MTELDVSFTAYDGATVSISKSVRCDFVPRVGESINLNLENGAYAFVVVTQVQHCYINGRLTTTVNCKDQQYELSLEDVWTIAATTEWDVWIWDFDGDDEWDDDRDC